MGRVARIAIIMITRRQTLLQKKDSIVDDAKVEQKTIWRTANSGEPTPPWSKVKASVSAPWTNTAELPPRKPLTKIAADKIVSKRTVAAKPCPFYDVIRSPIPIIARLLATQSVVGINSRSAARRKVVRQQRDCSQTHQDGDRRHHIDGLHLEEQGSQESRKHD